MCIISGMTRVQLRRALLGAAVSAAGVVPLLAACGDPYAETPEVPAPEAGTDAGGGVPEAALRPDPCEHVSLPGPPLSDDAPGEELPPFFIAVRTVSLTTAAKGFDLDGVCTCDGRPDTARDGGGSCAAAGTRCDLDGGVDNTVAVLAQELSPFFALDSIPNGLIARGRRTLLVQIGKYNGRANDKEIAVGFAMSDGIREKGCPTSVESEKPGIWMPGWCGDERWSFLPDAVLPASKQPLIQGVGYVSNGVLTMQVPTLLVPFSEASVLTLGSAMITGNLVPLGEDLKARDRDRPPTDKEKRLWSITEGVVAGRVKAIDLLVGMGTIDRDLGGDAGRAFLCEESQFSFLRTAVCNGVDIASSKALDFDPGATCDSLSMALTYTAFPALPGDVRTIMNVFNPCNPGPDGQPPDSGADPPYRCK
jgi:hypothetical protein